MTTSTENKPKQPTHAIYFLQNKEGIEKPEWVKVGAGWEHADGKGIGLLVNSLGHEVPLVIRKNKPKPD